MSKKARDGISTSPQITLGDHEYFQHRVLLPIPLDARTGNLMPLRFKVYLVAL